MFFNSRIPAYRNPVGAVAAGTDVHFRITMPRELHCSAAYLLVRNDETQQEETLGLFWCGMNGDSAEWWECDYTPKVPGLYFYRFETDTWRGRLLLGRGWGSEGAENVRESWQLTVYASGFRTPDWLRGGIMYQIFPDRFRYSGAEKKNVPEDRRYHENWLEQPQWQPDETGEITNKDYFRGDLRGIAEKLDYLTSLGVTCLYLNPLFEAHSNHRYDTADYSRIDPLLGDETEFRVLCLEARKRGIRVMLDGVFSHTGSDSVYFNRQGRYPTPGAYNSRSSPYYGWYTFQHWPDRYTCWWNFITLPNVNETNPDYSEYISGENGIARKWLRDGASAWRLDVADELPDEFLDRFRGAVKAEDPDALVLGEVWEDASNKSAYGKRRRYLLGDQLDSVMNYPFRSAVLGFLTGGNPGDMMEIILSVLENYPPQVVSLLMNHIGTHDTERALTVLAGEPLRGHGRKWQSAARLSPENRERGLRLMKLAALMQYTLPGVPCVYYGDEAGVEGYRDPFNRSCYPWGQEEQALLSWYRRLGKFRKEALGALREGSFAPLIARDGCMAYTRSGEGQTLLAAVNAQDGEKFLDVPDRWQDARVLLGSAPSDKLRLPPLGCALLLLEKKE